MTGPDGIVLNGVGIPRQQIRHVEFAPDETVIHTVNKRFVARLDSETVGRLREWVLDRNVRYR